MSVHRVKSYSAESGYVFQYSFQAQRRARRGWFTEGTEFVFEVSRDRKSSYLVPVFVRDDALKGWAKRHGRELSSAECYAAGKMRLLRAFDQSQDPEEELLEAVVNAENIEELLEPLGVSGRRWSTTQAIVYLHHRGAGFAGGRCPRSRRIA